MGIVKCLCGRQTCTSILIKTVNLPLEHVESVHGEARLNMGMWQRNRISPY